jgi:transposase
MGNPAGVRRDFDALEERRLKAAKLFKQGVAQAEIARQLGVHRQSVYRWQLALQREGRAGLKKAGRAGRKPKLSEMELRQVERILKAGAEESGYETGLWTIRRVAEVIERNFGVSYDLSQVWRILRGLGWSAQRPRGRAIERDEEAITRWKKERWPTLKKTPGARGKRSSSSTRAD